MTPLSAMGPVDIYGPDTFTIDHFADSLLAAIAGTTFLPDDETGDQLQERYRGTCAAFSAIPTRDPLDQMLAAQAVGAHGAVMECFRRAMTLDINPWVAASLRNNAVSLSRMMRDLVRTIQQRARDAMPAVSGNDPIHREEPAARSAATADQTPAARATDQWHDPIRPEDAPSPAAATPLGQSSAGQLENAREGQEPMQSGGDVIVGRGRIAAEPGSEAYAASTPHPGPLPQGERENFFRPAILALEGQEPMQSGGGLILGRGGITEEPVSGVSAASIPHLGPLPQGSTAVLARVAARPLARR